MAEFIEELYTDEWEVETPTGWKDFDGIGKTIPYQVYEIIFDNEESIKCADTHIFIHNDHTQIYCKDLKIGDVVDNLKHGFSTITDIIIRDESENMYDLINVDGSIYTTNNISSHNSTIVSAYALWFAVFHSNKNIGIVSNKEKAAISFLTRLKYQYELLPAWLKPGAEKWAEKSVHFENKTTIQVAATSKDSFRGEPMSLLICVTGDNEVTVRDKITNEVKTIKMSELAKELENNKRIRK